MEFMHDKRIVTAERTITCKDEDDDEKEEGKLIMIFALL